jgi:hypothetical protein
VSADKVATAIAFQSVMTVESPAGAAEGVAAAAVPAAKVIRSGTAAQIASHERAFAGQHQSKAMTRKRPFPPLSEARQECIYFAAAIVVFRNTFQGRAIVSQITRLPGWAINRTLTSLLAQPVYQLASG